MDYRNTDAVFLPRHGLKLVYHTFTEVLYGKTITLYGLKGRDGSIARISARSLTLLRARPVCTKSGMLAVIKSLSASPLTTRESWATRDKNIAEQLNRGLTTDHGDIIRLLYRLDGTHWAYSRFLNYDTALQLLAEEFAYLYAVTHAQAIAYIRQQAKEAHNALT